MKKELLEVRKYIWLVLIGVLSYWLLNHFYIFFDIVNTIFKVLAPFILGGVIAFILNIPMSKIESLLKEKTKKCLTVRVGHDKLIKSPKQGDEKFFEN